MKPFIKWAGGKRQILEDLLAHAPKEFKTYFEPFLGGGALFFGLAPGQAVVSDINEELINALSVVKSNLGELIDELLSMKNSEKEYYAIRELQPEELSQVKRAARFIYLNKTCFNGLYRVNKKNKFNVPYGHNKKTQIVDTDNLQEISDYLNSAKVKITSKDYREVLKTAKKGDFVFLDPPQYPANETSFTAFQKEAFGVEQHQELLEIFKDLDKRGCKVMLCNANMPVVRELYKGYKISDLFTSRSINSVGSNRGKTNREILIKNF